MSHAHTLWELLDAYEREYLPHQAKNTQKRKRSQFRLFRATLGNPLLEDVTPALLRTWRDRLSTQASPGTVGAHLHALSGVLRVAIDDYEWLASNPLMKVKKPRLPEERVRFLDAPEQAHLLAACQRSPCQLLYPLVLLALTTGARKMECLMLRWSDVDLESGVMRLVRTKNRLRRGVPIPSVTCQVLQGWQEILAGWGTQLPSLYVFPGIKAQPPDINRRWMAARDQAGLFGFRFHDLRHTAASYLAMSGVRIEVIAEILGHKSLATTRRYAHFTTGYTLAAVEHMAGQFITLP